MTATECPFCNISDDRIWVQTDSAIAVLDNSPVSPGHTLVIPGNHIGALMELPESELNEIWSLVAHVRKLLIEKHKPDGFSIGFNEGPVAGQTVIHAHIYVIPRFKS
jgi:diadenosine tetraphosphate (Ap4A) HIT family hydrolase